jgi:hypothetical protein
MKPKQFRRDPGKSYVRLNAATEWVRRSVLLLYVRPGTKLGEAGRMTQKVLHCHGPFGSALLHAHLDIFELGEILRDWRAYIYLSFLGQNHDGQRT